jgi:hypothetical protein
VSHAFIVGYDPGGNDSHGVAALEVRRTGASWSPVALDAVVAHSLSDALAWLDDKCRNGRIAAVGIDTLTEWNSGGGGWRPADLWLRDRYRAVARSVVAPNSIYGSMALNGAAFMTLLAPRFRADDTLITEAHPKVCFFAMTGKQHDWVTNRMEMGAWLLQELGATQAADVLGAEDHRFDAGVALLAAFRGLNGDWTLDLHALPASATGGRVQFCGQTHYWWPGFAGTGRAT